MKKLLTLLFLINGFITGRAAIISPADSVFVSGGSCNIKVEFFKGNKATAFIDGKTRTGTVFKDGTPKAEQDQYYYFSENGKKVFYFLFSEGQMIILNQQYQFACEDAKGITLNRVVKKLLQVLILSASKAMAAFRICINIRRIKQPIKHFRANLPALTSFCAVKTTSAIFHCRHMSR